MTVLGEFAVLFEGRPEWMDDGACVGLDPDYFHPRRGRPTEPAKDICSQCPVRSECLEFALAKFLKVGVWGGTSERERRLIRRERRTAARLGMSIDEARVFVAGEIAVTIAARSESRPLLRLIRRYGYTREQAAIVLARARQQRAHRTVA